MPAGHLRPPDLWSVPVVPLAWVYCSNILANAVSFGRPAVAVIGAIGMGDPNGWRGSGLRGASPDPTQYRDMSMHRCAGDLGTRPSLAPSMPPPTDGTCCICAPHQHRRPLIARVSVLDPARDEAATIDDRLASVRAPNAAADLEILVLTTVRVTPLPHGSPNTPAAICGAPWQEPGNPRRLARQALRPPSAGARGDRVRCSCSSTPTSVHQMPPPRP